MSSFTQIEEIIQDYVDGLCTLEEAKEIAIKIEQQPEWKKVYQAYLQTNAILKDNSLMMQPSLRFTKNVMEAIEPLKIAKPSKEYINPVIVWIITGTLGGMLLIALGYAWSQTDWSSQQMAGFFKIPDLDLPKINWTGFLNTPFQLLIFLVFSLLGFTLLDQMFGMRKKSIKSIEITPKKL